MIIDDKVIFSTGSIVSGRTLRQITLFLASPGDVNEERARVRAVAEEINRGLGQHHGFVLRVVSWETDATPEFGADPQNLLNAQIARMEEYDFFVGIMWNRFGQSTPRAESGTEEEFRLAVKSLSAHGRPEIMLYFGQKPFNPRSTSDAEQKGKVLAFKEGLQQEGIYWEYLDTNNFEKLFREHLQNRLMRQLPQPPPPVPAESAQASSQAERQVSDFEETVPAHGPQIVTASPAMTVEDSGTWVLLGETFFESESVTDKGEGTVMLEIAPTGSEQRVALSALRGDRAVWSRHEPLAYAHGDDAGIARVESAESRSAGGRVVWTVTLKLGQDNDRHGGLADMGINDLSADQVAELRARLLLLNEQPPGFGQRDATLDMVAMMIIASLKAKAGVLPEFWQRYRSRPALFLPLARLWAIYHLKVNQICEHVLELRLGPLEPDRSVGVTFRGRRHKRYSNEPAAEIRLEGRCRLTTNQNLPP